ncbi:Hypothetical Protein FCC1311_041972 [Hondaea fermentalgiana]|uniref:Uncharacterized protein n=1 Tax=Hondaea fermentalgiana TaxID=2315210 RepID=A0A2R5GJD5_9STRA|nr:Hypothetical Protein FCC1311_041972 [Hondaea fermentalgiana]|eukprot:GBG27974.1 Hypothetical Protein FCC1311_041972 [Hondaea fermentalgiana]
MAGLCGNTAQYMPEFFYSYYAEPILSPPCGHGDCVVGVCVCEDGWTGLSDFITTEGIACDINNVAIKALWAINLLILFVCVFHVRDDIKQKRAQHIDLVKQKELSGKKYTVYDNKGYAAILAWLAFCLPGSFAMGILKLVTNDQRVGQTWAMTVFFFVAKLGFYLSAFLYQPQLLATILKGSRSQAALVHSSRIWGFCNMLLSMTLGLLPFVTLLASETYRDETAQLIYILYMAGSVLSMLVFGVQALVIQIQFNKIMGGEMASKSKRADEIKQKLSSFQRGTYTQATVQGLIYGIFLFVPALWNKHDYFLPISWISFHLLFRKMATSTITTKRVGISTTDTGSLSKDNDGSFTSKNEGNSVSSFVVTRSPPTATASPSNFRSFQEKAYSFHEPDPITMDDDDDYV